MVFSINLPGGSETDARVQIQTFTKQQELRRYLFSFLPHYSPQGSRSDP